jgi:putative ABC transport system permease protein
MLFLVVGEALVITVVGAVIGVGFGVFAVQALTHVGSLVGVFHPYYAARLFGRALMFAFGMAMLGAIYPAMRAAGLRPLVALQHE